MSLSGRRESAEPAGGWASGQGIRADRAPAKVNLTLEIKGRRPDGYHELESLVLFADFGDRVQFRPAADFSLAIEGPFADSLAGEEPNLVISAARAFAATFAPDLCGAFDLTKELPVAAGLGGGSADAAAALRILKEAAGTPEDLAALVPLASSLGADIPCCLYARAALMTGIGEVLHPLPAIDPVPAVLVNPRLPLSTGAVFRTLAAGPLEGPPAPPNLTAIKTSGDLFDFAQARSNDLEPPAIELLPVIGEILDRLTALPGSRLARLSGSGPTCFAIFDSTEAANVAASELAEMRPDWWIKPVRLS